MKIRVVCTVLFLILLTGATTVRAQFHDRDLPTDSVAWWTLTDALSPEALRETYRSPLANLKRYRRAVAAGDAEQLSPERAQELTFYLSAQRTPELIPMWFAFEVFAGDHLALFGRDALSTQLRATDISDSGIQIVLEAIDQRGDLFLEATQQIWPLQREFLDLQKRAEKALGSTREAHRIFRAALTRSDAEFLAPLGSETVAKTAELLAAAKADPGLRASEIILPQLKKALSEHDWTALRAFLLTEVAARMGSLREFEG